jgi:hypothetical protein
MRISRLEKSFWNSFVNVSPIAAAPRGDGGAREIEDERRREREGAAVATETKKME